MAAILQLRRGSLNEFYTYGTNLSEPFFDTDRDTLQIGTINGSGSNADFITIVKLSQANRDWTKDEQNSGSLWITGNYTGSSMYLSGDVTSSNAWFKNDVRIDGHLIMGDSQPNDVVTIKSDFSGSLIPDNDKFGTLTPNAQLTYFDLGSDAKRWKNIYLQRDGANDGFLSGSNIDLTGKIKVDGEGRFGTLRVDDLTDNRIMLVGTDGEVEDDENLTYDGQDFRLTNSDYYQSGSGASFQFDGAGMNISGSISNFQLRVDNGIVFTNAEGTLDNQSQFTWDGGLLKVDGSISGSGTLEIDGQSTLASLMVEDLTNDRILIAGVGGEVEDDQYFRYTGNDFIIGAQEHFKVNRVTGNTFISGAVQMFSTLNVDAQSTLASVNVEDLTDNRVVIVGAGGEIEDDGNFTFNGTELNIGIGNFTVQQGSGNTQILGTLDVDSQSTLSSLNVQDLTDNRIVIAGTNGEIEDDANFTFNGTELNIGTGNFTVQQGSGNTQILGTLDVDSQSTLSSVNVQDLTSGRVVLAGVSGEIEDSGNLTFDGSLLTVTGDTIITGDLTVQGDTTQLNVSTLNVEDKNILIASGAVDATAADGGGITIDGADATILYSSTNDSFQLNKQLQVEGNISGSSFGGTTLLSSSNENFADYSQSVDSRLDSIEGPMSTSLDSRLIEIFATGSDHETRVDLIEGTMSSSFDLRILESFSTASDHELRLLESFSTASDHETRIDVIETTYATTGSNSFVGDQIITGSLIVSSSSTFTNMGPTVLSGSVSISGSINSVDYIDFNTSSLVDGKPGRLRWNDTDGTLDLTLKKGNVTLQVGQETVINAYNNTTSSLLESEVRAVYVSGSVSNFPAVNLADNLTRRASENTIGIVTEDIGVGELGYITTQGMVRNVDMSSFSAGDTLYLGAENGVLVNTPPLPPALTVIMGYCINNDAVTGSMYVNVRSGFEYPQYAIAYNLSNHTASLANTETLIDMDTPQVQSGITVVDGSKFTVSTPGLYEFVTIAQINRDASSGTASMYFWAKKNGVDVPNSNNNIDITGNTGTAATLLDRNLVIVLEEGDYIQFYWATDDTDMILKYSAAGTSPIRPATPAVKITATRIS